MGFQGPGPALDREKMPPLCDTERCLKLYSWHESWKVYKTLKKCYGPTRNYLCLLFSASMRIFPWTEYLTSK